MIIILEGHDLAGKSHIASLIKRFFIHEPVILKKPLNIIKRVAPELLESSQIELFSEFFFTSLEPFLEDQAPPVIVDRSLLSSLVFSKIYNRDYNLDYIKKYLNLKNILIVLLTVSNSECLHKRFNKRGDQFFSLQDIINIRDTYLEVYQDLKTQSLDSRIEHLDTSEFDGLNYYDKVGRLQFIKDRIYCG